MKALFIQLARLGDIYMMWPTLKAYHRSHPESEIHVLVRPKFAAALDGINIPIHVHVLPSESIVQNGRQKLIEFNQSLVVQDFDSVFNLSFSPFSSYLTKNLDIPRSNESAPRMIRGYTRTDDDYLAFGDDWSAYFYAQVGINRENRIHVTDLFAEICEVSLQKEDFIPPSSENTEAAQIIIHVGGSEPQKRISVEVYNQVIETLSRETLKENSAVWLVGSGEAESAFADKIIKNFSGINIENKVGHFTLRQISNVIDQAALLIAPDSVMLHIASLTQTPVLNLSANVNFWETGPKSNVNAVLEVKAGQINQAELSKVLQELMSGEVQPRSPDVDSFGWNLIEFIYFGGTPPRIPTRGILPFTQVRETNDLMVQTLKKLLTNGRDELQIQVLERGDEILKLITDHCSESQVIYRWYVCEKMRIGPGDFKTVCSQTLLVHERLSGILRVLSPQRAEIVSLVKRIQSGCQTLVLSKSLNEKSLQEIVERLFEFSQASIQIVDQQTQQLCFDLSNLLEAFLGLLAKKDFNEVRLFLEYDVIPHFTQWEESLSDGHIKNQNQPREISG